VTRVVIDASVVLRWAFDDEADRVGAISVADALAEGRLDAVGPPNFLLEVAAALVVATRAGRTSRESADRVMTAMTSIAIDEVEPHGFAAASLHLALDTGIRLPDATYLEVARRRGAALISGDARQLEAAVRVGVPAIALNALPAF
jgi:predicted nucleic acid-binding protein